MDRNILKLGELLISQGKITRAQLEHAMEVQKDKKKKLGQILEELNYIDENDILYALEKQLGVDVLDFETFEVDPDVPQLVSEDFARNYELIPVAIKNNKMIVAMADPMNIITINDLEIMTGYEVEPRLAKKERIDGAIDKYFTKKSAEKAIEDFTRELSLDQEEIDEDLLREINKAPVVRLVNTIINQAVNNNASDIHIEPEEKYLTIKIRVDGDLREIMRPAIETHGAIITRIKIMSNMDIAERRRPQDGRIETKIRGIDVDMRVSSIPTIYGEKIVIRLLSREDYLRSLEEIGIDKDDLPAFKQKIKSKNGIILITGPTGSGKSTSMYSILNYINTVEKNIITLEDPVEYRMEGIVQSQVNPKAGYTFANGLRSFLRQDPDIIMVGEIRDTDTAQIATRAAITGHLVLSTLHTNNAVATINRLIDMGIKSYLLAGSLQMIDSQLLVKTICEDCKVSYSLSDSEKNIMKLDIDANYIAYKGEGCSRCNNTGYYGRTAVHEIVVIDKQIRRMISGGEQIEDIKDYLEKKGVNTLVENTRNLVLDGKTTIEEYLKISYARGE